jgi:hypothetical protein
MRVVFYCRLSSCLERAEFITITIETLNLLLLTTPELVRDVLAKCPYALFLSITHSHFYARSLMHSPLSSLTL